MAVTIEAGLVGGANPGSAKLVAFSSHETELGNGLIELPAGLCLVG